MNKYEAQHYYWSSFGLLAFDEQTVPDVIPDGNGGFKPLVEPYLTYETVDGRLDGIIPANARLLYRGRSLKPITDKVIEMEKKANRQIPLDGGGMMKVRVPFTNFARELDAPQDDQLRTMVITVEIEFITY